MHCTVNKNVPQLFTRNDPEEKQCKDFGTTFALKNKTIGDEGITVDFWIIKVHTSN